MGESGPSFSELSHSLFHSPANVPPPASAVLSDLPWHILISPNLAGWPSAASSRCARLVSPTSLAQQLGYLRPGGSTANNITTGGELVQNYKSGNLIIIAGIIKNYCAITVDVFWQAWQ